MEKAKAEIELQKAKLEADIEINALSPENPLGRRWEDGAPSWGVVDAPSALLHEVGHVIQLRREGVEASAPMFIPFLGAVISAKSLGDDAAAGWGGDQSTRASGGVSIVMTGSAAPEATSDTSSRKIPAPRCEA